jgi:SAM-dependent methyltransferase
MSPSPHCAEAADCFAASLEPYYDGQRSLLSQWFDRHRRHDAAARFALTFERLGDLSGKRGLDIGCGSGLYLAEAIRRGAGHVVGVDAAPGMLELARRRMEALGRLDRLTLLEGYFPETCPAGVFDFAMVVGVLDYVADPAAFLVRLRTILSGQAVVSFPSRHWIRAPLRRFRYRLRNCPVYFYSQRQICALAEEAGFSAVDVIKMDAAPMDFHVCLAP